MDIRRRMHVISATTWVSILGGFLYALPARASDSAAVSAPASPNITWSGYVDVYYSWNFNRPANQMNQLRNFDMYDDQFGLNLAKVTMQAHAQPVSGRVDIALGTGNDVVQGLLNPLNGKTVPSTSTLNVVEQAYLTSILPVGSGLTVDIGKFATVMGYEVIESNGNWNYGRSLLFAWGIPYYHMGMRLTYPVAANFTVALHLVNSWNTVVDNNRSKSVGLGITYSPGPATTLTLNGMSGFEQPADVSSGRRSVGEIIATQSIGDNVVLALDAEYGQERFGGVLNTWKGVAVYGKYGLCAMSDIAVRGEVYYDPDGYTTGVSYAKPLFKELTLTYEYRPWSPVIVRFEGRVDGSNGNAFVGSGSPVPDKSKQPTILMGIITTF